LKEGFKKITLILSSALFDDTSTIKDWK